MAKVKEMFDEFMGGSKMFGELISAIINLLLLSIVYFIGVGLTSIFVMIVLYLEYRKFIIELITLSKSIRIVHFNRTNL